MTESVRVYVPATMKDLAALHETGVLVTDSACAVTESLRALLPDEDGEGLEHEALLDAAERSVDRLALDPGADPRRVVLAADLPADVISEDPLAGASYVRLRGPVLLVDVVSAHVDDPDIGSDVGLQTLTDLDLLWYSAEEFGALLSTR